MFSDRKVIPPRIGNLAHRQTEIFQLIMVEEFKVLGIVCASNKELNTYP